IKPDDPDVKYQIFNQYLLAKRFNDAEPYIEPLTRMNQDQANGMMIRFRYHYARAAALNDNTSRQRAVEAARELVKNMRDFGQSWLALGQALQMSAQFDEALSAFNSAIERQNDNVMAERGG